MTQYVIFSSDAAASLDRDLPTSRGPSPSLETEVRLTDAVSDVPSQDFQQIEGHQAAKSTEFDLKTRRESAKLNLQNIPSRRVPIRGRNGRDMNEESPKNAREACDQHCGEMLLELSRLKLERLRLRVEMTVKQGELAKPSLPTLLDEARALNSEVRGILKMI